MAKKKTYADAMADVTAAIEKYRREMRDVEDDFVAESDYQRRISKLKKVQKDLAREQERQKMEEQMAQMQQMQAQGMMPQQQGMPPGMPQGAPPMMPPQEAPMMGYGGYRPKMKEGGYTPEEIANLIPEPSKFSQFAQFLPDVATYSTIAGMEAPPQMDMPQYRPTQTDMSMVYNPAQAQLREGMATGKVGMEGQFSSPQAATAALSKMYSSGASQRAQLTADQLAKEFELRDAASRETADIRQQRQATDFANRMRQYQFETDKSRAKAQFGQDLGTKFGEMQRDKFDRDLARTGLSVSSQAYDQGMMQRFFALLNSGLLPTED